MRKLYLLTVVMLLAALTACSSQTDVAEPSVADVDVNSLPAEVDVSTTAALKDRADVVVLDVREQWEYDEGHIPGVTHIPMGEVSERLQDIPADKTVIVTCRSGNRSSQVTDFLKQNGYDNVHNMQGGILAWQQAGLDVEN